MSAAILLQAVTFDVGGTLIEPWPSVGHVYANVAAEVGLPSLDPTWLGDRFRVAWRNKVAFDYSRKAWLGLVQATFQGVCTPADVATVLFDPLYARFSRALAWKVYDDVFDTLAWLQCLKLPLAVISNWDDRLPPLLGELGLAPFFQCIHVSAQVGFHKPAREIFARTVAALGVPAASVLHVGDSRGEDFDGAKRAGLQSVLLRRGSVVRNGEEISSLRELPGLIGEQREQAPDHCH